MTPLQQSDLQALIGKKVKVLMAGRFYQRVLHEDHQGLYIRYASHRVPVKPDLNTLHILYFKALKPKGVR
ncbi:hypothetical protein ACFSO0_09585 [Brevibacillus sp. GCM10020057]|uniref:hypothetical protein n=1 Tax=Brevibacillus sp. GCM10020057 TaxID=3317327 RepID=UPI003630A397